MKWMRFRVRTRSEAEDILVSSMMDIGMYGAQIEDNVPLTASEKEQMFVDILPQAREDDGTAVLSFYVEETERGTVLIDGAEKTGDQVRRDMEGVIADLRVWTGDSGIDIGEGTVSVEETEDIDWINNWKQYFHQFWIDDILVIPSWEQPEQEEREPRLTLHIDPGTAFGTGMHETTQLCIRQIREYLTPQTRILDIGTGSGILAILSLMLGAASATGTDLDPCAPPAILENMQANGVDPDKLDWINNWKQYFHQFWIDDILVIPSWEQPEQEEREPRLTLHIDPGTAFGTGMHETTQLCIRQIREYLTPQTRILDIGTGSGILAILSLMLGAASATGTDLDPCAPPAILENMQANGVDPDKFRVILGNMIDEQGIRDQVGYEKYDIVAANILPDVLVPLTPYAAAALKKGGVYITSGILEGKEDLVADAMRKAGLTVTTVTAQGEWRCVTGRK